MKAKVKKRPEKIDQPSDIISISLARNLYLRGISLIYLFAFLSFYLQIPGLYGNQGILPARNQLQDSGSLAEKIHHRPTLLWLAPYLGLNIEYMMDVLCLLGLALSISAVLTVKLCTAPIFAALWSLYYSLYQVGQTFMWFQWDILLLEAGFITIIAAPLRYPFRSNKKDPAPGDFITFWLPRWLLFRLMFASGIVKLQSGCPTWWSLTALNVHFESQPIPTPLAWYLHQLPSSFLKLGTVYAQIVEQLVPFLFFFPHPTIKLIGFWNQLFLQGSIIISGNYNFFNILTIILCISLLDDSFFVTAKQGGSRLISITLNVLCHVLLIYLTCLYYGVSVSSDYTVSSDVTFTKEEFDEFVSNAVPTSIYIAGISLLALCLYEVYLALTRPKTAFLKALTLIITVQYIACACFLFGVSLVPYSSLHPHSNSTILPPLRKLHQRIDHLHVVNSYGLFRRMTGVGGRPEVILEGSNNIDGPWKELNFKYKPGNINDSLPFIAPYQPRLDWQMWFAALGTYHQNPWLMSLTYHLLKGDKPVWNLLDSNQPFTEPPKFIKASLYHYHYTGWSKRSSNTWWRREKVGEYFPIFTKDHTPLLEYLKSMDIIVPDEVAKKELAQVNPALLSILSNARQLSSAADPVLIIWSVINAIIILIGLQFIFKK